jgi:hypothetical protein
MRKKVGARDQASGSCLMTERRKHTRANTCDLVLVAWQDETGDMNRIGNVQDVSPTGLGVMLDCRLAVGTRVTVSTGDEEIPGIVRHVSELMNGLFTGIECPGGIEKSGLYMDSEAA